MTRWVRAAKAADLPEGDVIGLTVEGRDVALYNCEGTLRATDNICPHAFVLLSDGYFDGDTIECPVHAARFDVKTGRRLSGPAPTGLRVFPVKIEDGEVYVGLEADRR